MFNEPIDQLSDSDLSASRVAELKGENKNQNPFVNPIITHTLEAELKRQKLERFSQFFNRVNSALCLRPIVVSVENWEMDSPAWSTSEQITFNSRLIDDLTSHAEIATLYGLDLHEVCHILYSPRQGSELWNWAKEHDLFHAFNALDDQRIENFFIARFPSTKRWFISTMLNYFINNEKAFTMSYALLRGRTYLPTEILARSRNAFPEQDLIDELCEVVDKYKSLVFPNDTEIAKDLIIRYSIILKNLNVRSPNMECELPFGHGVISVNTRQTFRPNEGIESNVNSRPMNQKSQKRDSERIKQQKPLDDKSLANSTNNASPDGNSTESLKDILTDMLQKHISQQNMYDELSDIARQLRGLPSLSSNNCPTPPKEKMVGRAKVLATTFQASLSFSREMEKLKANVEPAWERYKEQGRLQPIRYLRGDDLDTIFDQWNEGRENDVDIECVVAVDVSGSMDSLSSKAFQAMYAIKKALDKVKADTTILTFNTGVKVLYDKSERASNFVKHGAIDGGTDPLEAIKYSQKLFAESDKPIKVFFIISDGDWSYATEDDSHDIIKKFKSVGILTAFAFLDNSEMKTPLTEKTAHYCETAQVVENPLDLVPIARTLVRKAISKKLTAN